MTRVLLDTHIWIWAVMRPERLGRKLRREIDATRNELLLSPVSIWEASLLAQRKRLNLRCSFAEWLDTATAAVPVQEAPLNFNVAAEAGRIHLPQSDVGDIFLAATASVFDLTLATADQQLLGCKWLKVLSND
ncbi:MAG: type II toxin-antitoxin system VapC family toxin [Bryobacteraceae bacterium]